MNHRIEQVTSEWSKNRDNKPTNARHNKQSTPLVVDRFTKMSDQSHTKNVLEQDLREARRTIAVVKQCNPSVTLVVC